MFNKSSRLLPVAAVLFLSMPVTTFAPIAFATSGACSGHGGVSCAAGPDTDGSVICEDNWKMSTVQYSDMLECVAAPEPIATQAQTQAIPPAPLPVPPPLPPIPMFTDTTGYIYETAIIYVKTNGIVNGYNDGSFKPNAQINRAEFTKILAQVAFPAELSTYKVTKSCFKDVPTDAWFNKYVCLAKEKGIIGGYSDGTFRPTQNINVAESLKITLAALYPNIPDSTDPTAPWYQKYVDYSHTQGYTLSEWTDINHLITRGEMAEFIFEIRK